MVERIKKRLVSEGYSVEGVEGEHTRTFQRRPHLLQFCCFGHIGDKNLHLNILATVFSPSLSAPLRGDSCVNVFTDELKRGVDRCVYETVLEKDIAGSVSAEHGIGQQKVHLMAAARSKEELEVMRAIKRALDPKGILNPGKIFPSDGL
jgi:FAD/FMN-containing dehydrogenase